uniref:Beta-mannosidase n=1 Tax=Acrobeloides nanus TaxID=290746 RepID=A0A914DQF4_9BILA
MQEANMNALRIWGGGLFEMDEFYNFADQYGILLLHDQMFGCALYSADDDFIQLLLPEFTNQVIRLRHRPSILSWAGNNENEVAITTQWWNVSNYNMSMEIQDYVTLYAKNMQPLITSLDPSRPFVLSSPSNGKETEEEGASKIVPILWLDIKPEVKETYQLKYWFSDNAFTMTDPQVTVQLKIFSSIRPTVTLTTQDFIVSRMKMSSSQTTTPTPNPGIFMFSFKMP